MRVLRVERRALGSASALLVHGNDLSGEFYLPLAESLADRGVETSLSTLAGFDGEPPYDRPSWDLYARDIADRIRQLEGSPKVLIGHSMGGLMAALAAARLSDELDRLVLIEPSIHPYRFMAKQVSRTYLKRVVRDNRAQFVNSTGFMPRVHDLERYPKDKIDLYLRIKRTSHAPTQEALFQELPELCPLPLSQISASTLMLNGAEIGFRGRFVAWLVRRLIPNVRHAVIDGAAHWVVNERDDALSEHIAGFSS